jgi:hypothetical protein
VHGEKEEVISSQKSEAPQKKDKLQEKNASKTADIGNKNFSFEQQIDEHPINPPPQVNNNNSQVSVNSPLLTPSKT